MTVKKKRMTKEGARRVLSSFGLDLKADYHTLKPSNVSLVTHVADMMGYRKPANANGSRGRYFWQYLQSKRGGQYRRVCI